MLQYAGELYIWMKFLLFVVFKLSQQIGVIWSMSAASSDLKKKELLSNRAAERNSTVISTCFLFCMLFNYMHSYFNFK